MKLMKLRLIIDEHDLAAFAPISHFTVGDFRNWLLEKMPLQA